MSGVHHIYDFAPSACPGQPPVSASVASVAAVINLAAADLDPGILHADLALLPITPLHHLMIMASSATSPSAR
jgi:hypothetical protein